LRGCVIALSGESGTAMAPAADPRIVPPAPHHLEAEASMLHTWAIQRGVSESKARCIVGLLNKRWMLKLPLPPCTWRKPGEPEFCWYRYLFQRHCKHVLNWTNQRSEYDPSGFGEDVNSLIRDTLFPDPSNIYGEDEGGSSGGGLKATTPTTAECSADASPSTTHTG
jgi:hypothetical protein